MTLINLYGIFSQGFVEFPDSGGRWKDVLIICWANEITHEPDYISTYHDVISMGDTTINDTLYFKILLNEYYEGAMRQDSCKVFYRPCDAENEFLLYDFCITDSFYWPVFEKEYYVTQIDSVIVGEAKRKRIFFDDDSGYGIGQFWIEGVGSSGGLLKPAGYIEIPLCEECCGGEQKLICHTSNGNLLYLDENYYNCDSLLTSLSELSGGKNLKIYPNPSDRKIIIELTDFKTTDQIDIFSIQGELINRKLYPEEKIIEFDLRDPGIYLIRISDRNNTMVRKLIIN